MPKKDVENVEKVENKANKIDSILDEIDHLSLIEANELAIKISEKYGISSNFVQATNSTGNAENSNAQKSEKVSVIVKSYKDGNKLKMVKKFSELNNNAPYLEAGKKISSMPFVIKENISSSEAEKLKEELIKEFGAEIEIK